MCMGRVSGRPPVAALVSHLCHMMTLPMGTVVLPRRHDARAPLGCDTTWNEPTTPPNMFIYAHFVKRKRTLALHDSASQTFVCSSTQLVVEIVFGFFELMKRWCGPMGLGVWVVVRWPTVSALLPCLILAVGLAAAYYENGLVVWVRCEMVPFLLSLE